MGHGEKTIILRNKEQLLGFGNRGSNVNQDERNEGEAGAFSGVADKEQRTGRTSVLGHRVTDTCKYDKTFK